MVLHHLQVGGGGLGCGDHCVEHHHGVHRAGFEVPLEETSFRRTKSLGVGRVDGQYVVPKLGELVLIGGGGNIEMMRFRKS